MAVVVVVVVLEDSVGATLAGASEVAGEADSTGAAEAAGAATVVASAGAELGLVVAAEAAGAD